VSARDYTETKPFRVGFGMRDTIVYGRIINGLFRRASEDTQCPRCLAWHSWNAKRIQGFQTEHECNVKCMSSKGPSCECSCGGANHGKSWIVCEAVAA
jgi:hypothetical protein